MSRAAIVIVAMIKFVCVGSASGISTMAVGAVNSNSVAVNAVSLLTGWHPEVS